MKKFPKVVHLACEENADGDEDFSASSPDGVVSLETGQRCAILHQLVREGTVREPKSFVPKNAKWVTHAAECQGPPARRSL